MADLVRLSKFLALMLRHKPAEFDLEPDEEGFVPLDDVWKQVKAKYGDRYTRDDLLQLLHDQPDQEGRFELVGHAVRSRYGHSTVAVDYPAVVPPAMLYHGTVADALPSIRKDGLQAMDRQFVHLSTHTDRAADVAARRGKVVILTIRARAAHDAGIVFHHPEPRHYLARAIPPQFIVFP